MPQLDPTGRPVAIGPFVVRSPGVTGRIEMRSVTARATRGGTTVDSALTRALASHGGRVAGVLEIIDATDVRATPAGRRRRSAAVRPPAFQVEVPAPGRDEVHALLGVDGKGDDAVYSWSFPTGASAAPPTRAVRSDTFTVRLQPAERVTPRERSLLGALGRKVVGWVVLPLARKAIGKGGLWVATRWETDHRPSRVRSFTEKNWNQPDGADLTQAEWAALGAGRALLLVHGTIDRASSSFGGFKPAMVRDLHKLYRGRVLAFDHPTLSVDPHANAAWLATQLGKRLPARTQLDVDLLCSSRGGLVARELGVWPDKLPLRGRGINVRRMVMMAVPNAGTPLADPKYMRAFLDTYTNLLRFLPDNGVTDVLEVVLELVKEAAAAILAGLPGLQAMNPAGSYIKTLNATGGRAVEYRSLASNFEPANDGFGRWAEDVVIDAVFKGKPNDLVVPRDGVWQANGADGFPLATGDHLELPAPGVTHGGFFRSADALSALQKWLVPTE